MCVGCFYYYSLCDSPLFCEDRATTSAGSISQGKPAADDSSYTFMATCNHTRDRLGHGGGTNEERREASGNAYRERLPCLPLTFMSVSRGMWSLKSSTELTRKGM